ncbi:hypothetical protein COHA_002061 [Chlorella ohadii]|uniref:AP2/ERF domain-containing protein n=1 Tax=Chlorella ohadii TaxID=2649997 RepID=A0AAD5H7S4_9CHLO|nr:hypothetical protein COHA_002061 [Chlorella ohadii]
MPPAAQATGPQPGQQGRKRSSSSSGSEGRPAAKRPVLVTLERSGRQSPSPLPCPSATGAASASGFRGVTYHQRTGRFESHIWCGKKQVYLGGWDNGSQAALAYDVAALRLRGDGTTTLNYHPAYYRGVAQQLAGHSIEEVVAALRALSRGGRGSRLPSSLFRGGKWEARIGTADRSAASKRYVYLGLHDSEVAAAMAYDRAAIREKGVDAATNFHLAEYAEELDSAQLADALQRGIITQADLHLRQQVAAVVAAGGHPGVLLSSTAEAAAVAAGSPSLYDSEPQSSAATQSAPGSPDLASLLFDCVCLDGESPTSVLPNVAAATAAGKAAAW